MAKSTYVLCLFWVVFVIFQEPGTCSLLTLKKKLEDILPIKVNLKLDRGSQPTYYYQPYYQQQQAGIQDYLNKFKNSIKMIVSNNNGGYKPYVVMVKPDNNLTPNIGYKPDSYRPGVYKPENPYKPADPYNPNDYIPDSYEPGVYKPENHNKPGMYEPETSYKPEDYEPGSYKPENKPDMYEPETSYKPDSYEPGSYKPKPPYNPGKPVIITEKPDDLSVDSSNSKPEFGDYDYYGDGPGEYGPGDTKPVAPPAGGNDKKCTCVPYYQCDDQGYVITDGSDLISPRNLQKPSKSKQDSQCSDFDVCCKVKGSQNKPPVVITPKPEVVPSEYEPEGEVGPPLEKPRGLLECGRRNAGGVGELGAGEENEALFGEWPWQAAVMKYTQRGGVEYLCNGVLVGRMHVLTTASCAMPFLKHPPMLTVRLGDWNMHSKEEPKESVDYRVDKMAIAPDYTGIRGMHDLALLRLERDVEFQQHIGKICLPDLDSDISGQCTVTGWEKNTGSKHQHYTLKETPAKPWNAEECKNSYGGFLPQGTACAKMDKFCKPFQLHSGSPLVCQQPDGSYSLTGLLVHSMGCTNPALFMNVGKYMDWLQRMVVK